MVDATESGRCYVQLINNEASAIFIIIIIIIMSNINISVAPYIKEQAQKYIDIYATTIA